MDDVGRTALIPFWARVLDASSADSILRDATALALAPAIEDRFGRIQVPDPVRAGCCLRNWLVDKWIAEIVSDEATIVSIGCGLDTRRGRLPTLAARHVEVDDPAVIEIRDEFLPDRDAVRVGGDGLDISLWIDSVKPGLTIVVLEGVLVYQAPARVRTFLDELTARLPEAYLIFDSLSPRALRSGNRPAVRGDRPLYVWSAARTRDVIAGGRALNVIDERSFADLPSRLTRPLGRVARWQHTLPPWRRAYRITLASMDGNQ